VSNQPAQAINEAVRDCLARCERGKTPLGVIAEYMGELRDKGWEESDVQTVAAAVRRVLAGIVIPPPQAKDNSEPHPPTGST
jgi:hypothetical protein